MNIKEAREMDKGEAMQGTLSLLKQMFAIKCRQCGSDDVDASKRTAINHGREKEYPIAYFEIWCNGCGKNKWTWTI